MTQQSSRGRVRKMFINLTTKKLPWQQEEGALVARERAKLVEKLVKMLVEVEALLVD